MSRTNGEDSDGNKEPVDIGLMVQAVIWLLGIGFIIYRLFSRGELGTEALHVTFGTLVVSWLVQGWQARRRR
jgi:hypothetical protein